MAKLLPTRLWGRADVSRLRGPQPAPQSAYLFNLAVAHRIGSEQDGAGQVSQFQRLRQRSGWAENRLAARQFPLLHGRSLPAPNAAKHGGSFPAC